MAPRKKKPTARVKKLSKQINKEQARALKSLSSTKAQDKKDEKLASRMSLRKGKKKSG